MHSQLVAIVNLTANSFSGDGLATAGPVSVDKLQSRIEELFQMGADWLDFGGQSTGPQSPNVSEADELGRLSPLWILAEHLPTNRWSVDTFYAGVAKKALQLGFGMINDVSGGRADSNMLATVADSDAKYVMMFCKNASGRADLDASRNVAFAEVLAFFDQQIEVALQAGIRKEQLILDPGMSTFLSTDYRDSLDVIKQMPTLKARYELPVYLGAARKGFLRYLVTDDNDKARMGASMAVALMAEQMGVDYIRLYDVMQTRHLLEAYATLSAWQGKPLVADTTIISAKDYEAWQKNLE